MITEDYVSFETAKLLKEKGFDEGCSFVVNTISKGEMPVSWPTTNSEIEDDKASLIALPTLQMAMKWLREVHHLFIQPRCCGWNDTLVYYSNLRKIPSNEFVDDATELLHFKTYEEACEAAIKYCLENLI